MRKILLAAVAAASLLSTASLAEDLVFASWGGTYQEAIRKVWLNPSRRRPA